MTTNNKNPSLIYGLFKSDGQCVYIGRTDVSLESRLNSHKHYPKPPRMGIHKWLMDTGEKIEIRLLENVGRKDNGLRNPSTRERHWIMKMLSEGHPLKNVYAVKLRKKEIAERMESPDARGQGEQG